MPLPRSADDELSSGMPPPPIVVVVAVTDMPLPAAATAAAAAAAEDMPIFKLPPTAATLCVRGDVSNVCVAARLIFPDVIDVVSAVGMPLVGIDVNAVAAAAEWDTALL